MRKALIASPGIKQLESKRGYRDGIGYTIELRYKGTQLECGAALEALVFAGGVIDASIDPDERGLYTLTAAYSARNATTDNGGSPLTGPESVVTTWSRQVSSQEKTLWEKPEVKSVLSLYPEDDGLRDQFRTKIEQYFKGEISQEEYDTWVNINFEEHGPTAQQRYDFKKLRQMFSAGVESFRVDSFVIVRNQVGAPDQLRNDDATINRMWSRATLILQPTMPSWFKNVVPDGYFHQFAAEITILDNAKIQVTQMWQWVERYEVWIHGEPI